jgi:hypothetical protein
VIFYGEKGHVAYVKSALERVDGNHNIDFIPINVPKRKTIGLKRLLFEFLLSCKFFTQASNSSGRAVIFCSITSTILLSIKILLRWYFNLPTLAIIHSCLSAISKPQARRPWLRIVGLQRVLKLPHPPRLRLIALSQSILDNIIKLQPDSGSHWNVLPLTYFWESKNAYEHNSSCSGKRLLTFGFLGVGAKDKGLSLYCKIADAVAQPKEMVQFIVAGYYSGSELNKPNCRFISEIPVQPLSQEKYDEHVKSITYVVSTANPIHYNLTASATFLDALSFLKPGIYLRNEYIEHYFKKMGNIGYLCDSPEEIVETIQGIITDFSPALYQQQVENIINGRVIFEPEIIAPQLRNIVDVALVL